MEGDAIMKGDKLILRGLLFHGYHGVKPEENKLGQKFLVDIDAWMDLRSAGESDRLSDTVSYTDIYRWVVNTTHLWAHHLVLWNHLESVVLSYSTNSEFCLCECFLLVESFFDIFTK